MLGFGSLFTSKEEKDLKMEHTGTVLFDIAEEPLITADSKIGSKRESTANTYRGENNLRSLKMQSYENNPILENEISENRKSRLSINENEHSARSYESSNNPLTKRNSFHSPHEEEKEPNTGNQSLDFEENENDSPRIVKVEDGSPKIGRNAERENPVDPQQLISMST